MRTKKSRIRRRNLFVESLEDRKLLAGIVEGCGIDPHLDVNDDGFVTAQDALITITEINVRGAYVADIFTDDPYIDVNGDGIVSGGDALAIINVLNRHGAISMIDLVHRECDDYSHVIVGDPPIAEVTTATDVVFADIDVNVGYDTVNDLFLTFRGQGENLDGRGLRELRYPALIDTESGETVHGWWVFGGQDSTSPFETYVFANAITDDGDGQRSYDVHGSLAGYTEPGTQFWVEHTNRYAIPEGWDYQSSPVTVVDSGISMSDSNPDAHGSNIIVGESTVGRWRISTTETDVPLTRIIVSAFIENVSIDGDGIGLFNLNDPIATSVAPVQIVNMYSGEEIPIGSTIIDPVFLVFDIPSMDFTAVAPTKTDPVEDLTFGLNLTVLDRQMNSTRPSSIQVGIDNLDSPDGFGTEYQNSHIEWLQDGVIRTGLPVGTSSVWSTYYMM